MAPIETHYDVLGVAPHASPVAIRAAYHRAAREHHPDLRSHPDSSRMAEINEAYSVLRDPVRRRAYDLSLLEPVHQPVVSGPVEGGFVVPRFNPLARYQDPPRLPWRFMGLLLLLGVGLVVLGVITASDPVSPSIDNVLDPGACVVIEPNGDAAERLCSEAHDGVVELLLVADGVCPAGSEPHRDRQGMGTACVTLG